MLSTDAQDLQSYHPYSKSNEKTVLSYLNNLKNIEFAFKMPPDIYLSLATYFIDITEERSRSLPSNYFEQYGVTLLMQSFIAKLRLQSNNRYGSEVQLLNRLPTKVIQRLLEISPGTVLRSLFTILQKSPNHSTAQKLLNYHPIVFANLILSHPSMVKFSLLRAVTNPIGLKLLAKKLSTNQFLSEFNTTDASKIPPLITTSSGDAHYAQISNPTLRLYTIVAEPLIRSATVNDTLDDLCEKAPPELKSLLPMTIMSIASMRPMPQCLIPYVSGIATRFSTSVFGRVRDPLSLVRAFKLFELEAPHLVDHIATLTAKTPSVWPVLSVHLSDMPGLNYAIRFYFPYMLQNDTEKCLDLLCHIHTTDKAAVDTINILKPILPRSFKAILNCSECGKVAFRVAAGIATAEQSMWKEFTHFYRRREEYLKEFLDICTDFIIAGNFLKALKLLDLLSTYYAENNTKISLDIFDYIYKKFAQFNFYGTEVQTLFVKVFSRVHKFSAVAAPIVAAMPEMSSKCLNLLIRYLWTAVKDEDPSLLEFRLKLLRRRFRTSREPRPWTDEIIMIDH